MIFFILAKEFGWTPSQIRRQRNKDISGIMHILGVYNEASNRQIEEITNKGKKSNKKNAKWTVGRDDPNFKAWVLEAHSEGKAKNGGKS